jgi:hypothetical protein
MARGDPNIARERLEAFMDELDAVLSELPAADEAPAVAQDFGGQTTTIVAGRPGARSVPSQPAQLHRGA